MIRLRLGVPDWILVRACFILLAIALLAAYKLQLAPTNQYFGYRDFPVDFEYLVNTTISLLIIGVLIPAKVTRPSDFFVFLYSLFVLMPHATLHPIRSAVDGQNFVLYFFALTVPILVLRMLALRVPSLRIPALISQTQIVGLLLLCCAVGAAYSVANAPDSAGFDLVSSYDRRSEGREIFLSGSWIAYLNAAVVNGFAPFVAFIAGSRGKLWLFVLPLLCNVAFFYVLGVKAPLLFVVLAALIGHLIRHGIIGNLISRIQLLIFVAFVVFFVEYVISGYSYIGDYFIRRAFSVPPFLISAYFDFIASAIPADWTLLGGATATEPISFFIGERFLGVEGLNANTNSFVSDLAAGGFPAFGLTVVIVVAFFSLLDAVYLCKRNTAMLYIGFSYAILLTEQSATTALLSSGLGFLTLLNLVSKAHSRKNVYVSHELNVLDKKSIKRERSSSNMSFTS